MLVLMNNLQLTLTRRNTSEILNLLVNTSFLKECPTTMVPNVLSYGCNIETTYIIKFDHLGNTNKLLLLLILDHTCTYMHTYICTSNTSFRRAGIVPGFPLNSHTLPCIRITWGGLC